MVSSIGGFNPVNFAATTGLDRASSTSDSNTGNAVDKNNSAADTFMTYMKKSPAERMVENWLKAHGLDQAKLDAMSPEDRDAVMKQMQKEIADQLKQQTDQKAQIVDLMA